jgi:cyclohexyl-isocyanide hydratase
MNRREFAQLAGVSAIAALIARESWGIDTPKAATATHDEVMAAYSAMSAGQTLQIGLLVYPGMFLQDLVGPLTLFEALMNREIHLIWKNTTPFQAAGSAQAAWLSVQPTTTYATCPKTLDVLFVPGGIPGSFTLMEDAETLSFLQQQGERSRFITSVCTGSLVLGAAGLLKGYRAATHWLVRDALKPLGAKVSKQRVVVDRNRITGGGVTAGLDFGLTVIEQLRGRDYAEAVQLYLEYDPKPPFRAGSPETAPAVARQMLELMFAEGKVQALALAEAAGKRI